MKADILEEKEAILQQDSEKYAIAPHIPRGFLDVIAFKRMVDVAEKFRASALKLTSGQRIAIIGLREEDLDAVWRDLEMSIGLCYWPLRPHGQILPANNVLSTRETRRY